MILSTISLAKIAIALTLGALFAVAGTDVQVSSGPAPIVITSPYFPAEFELSGVIVSLPRPQDIAHESGHWQQEQQLGPAYTAVVLATAPVRTVVGVLLILFEGHDKATIDYHRLPVEAWADQLGGITR